MVFTNLGVHEKDALFSLLDEYFASRPEIFSSGKADSPAPATGSNPFRKEVTGPQTQAAAAAVGRAGDAAARFVSAGLKGVSSGTNASGKPPPAATAPGQHGHNESMDTRSGGSLADRMAALQAGNHNGKDGNAGAPNARTGGVSSLSATKKFGDVDVSSPKNFFGSLRNTSSNPPKSSLQTSSPADNVSSAFPPKNSGSRFGPPPTRAPVAAPPVPSPPSPEPQQEEQREWAEALYDFETTESGDLELKENQRVLIIERTSDDWWTGEIDGRKGLFPASYVKLL